MYKRLFIKAWFLISKPEEAWVDIAKDEDKTKYLNEFFYPLIALSAITAFIYPLISDNYLYSFKEILSECLINFTLVFASLFLGMIVAAWIINLLSNKFLGIEKDDLKAKKLVVFSSVPFLLASILVELMNDLFFMKFFYLYVIIEVWAAANYFYKLKENRTMWIFIMGASIIILFTPQLVEFIIQLLLPGMK